MPKRPSRYSKGVKRGRAYRAAGKYPLRYYYGPNANKSAATLQSVVKRAIAQNNKKMLETKHSNYTRTDGLEIFHNNFISLDTNMLLTTQGVEDPTTNSSNNRIGDKIYLKGVAIKMMCEINERYSSTTWRLLIVKKSKGDTLDRSTLFNGLSGNKMLDTINTERYTILYQKYFTIKTAGQSQIGAASETGAGNSSGNQVSSRATRIIKCWIPGKRFTKSGIITYENGTSQPKFFDYVAVLYCYSNYSTLQDVFYVGRLNDYIATMYYTDA